MFIYTRIATKDKYSELKSDAHHKHAAIEVVSVTVAAAAVVPTMVFI